MKMKLLSLIVLIPAILFIPVSCKKEELSFLHNDLKIEIETGKEWLHNFPLFLGLNKKNPPQFAIWLEDTGGNYLTTLFVTHKIAAEAWVANEGNRRKESLPHWCFQRGVVYEDGLMLPTKQKPFTDGISGATPKENKTIALRAGGLRKPFIIKAEFNHSIDFNDYFTEDAKPGDTYYSGGKSGSGQPAVVYTDTLFTETNYTELKLIGHSSPDGSQGRIYPDLRVLSTAKHIVKKISVTLINEP